MNNEQSSTALTYNTCQSTKFIHDLSTENIMLQQHAPTIRNSKLINCGLSVVQQRVTLTGQHY